MMPRILLAATAAALALTAPAAAGAATTFTIRGAGFGHGVGLSQYGAMGMAKQGWDHARILEHYFTGTQLGEAPADSVVRVLLQSPQTARFSGATAAGTRELDASKTYGARGTADGRVRLLSDTGRTLATFDAPMRVTNADDAPIKLLGAAGNGVTDGSYRGWFEFRPGTLGEVLAINAIGLEQYTAGVVANESPASWPMEALMAQAIAARTYAITTSRDSAHGWDQYPDTRSQVYRGVIGETANTNRAVNGTRGDVVTYAGEPVTTFFFSTSGGRTENVENGMPGATPKPYLKSVDDPYDDVSPYHRWGPITMTRKQAGAKLGSLVKGSFKGIKVTERGGSPRVVQALVLGSKGTTTVTGAQLRSRFGLRDTWMTFDAVSADVEMPVDAPATPSTPTTPATPAGATAKSDGSGGAHASRLVPARMVGSARTSKPGTSVVLQRLAGGRWVRAGATRLGSTRRFKVYLHGRGTYRVLVGRAVGPTLRAAR